ncbi:TldD/PmbA family protein [Microbulbifer hydrolyticus]|uniref:TldD protein n=1 Tax=Microbulbifer hydrolyticus TaxID=48074 RepID=A0A6P1TFU4_9GAMM|nr:TldD/PmbA family protein [Microbulbifer hydrolyticus]MBB5211878.1 TldD protein [Microbulbifer hydrolyticus]QHQ40536.1 TldD/PmbA family protein [Microbulbifer hydrolyticus]
MDRRRFIKLAGVGAGGIALPIYGAQVSAEQLIHGGMDVARKKALSDTVLNAARKAGASYTDVRIGRYLNQFLLTRETNVENIVNTESFGAGIRVIANGTWGFAATNDLTEDGIARAARQAVAVAKANAKYQTEPVQLAAVKGVGEVSWQTPIKKNAIEVPISEKVDFLMNVNQSALKAGASFVNSALYLVNEQKYFASSDGSYIDQDVHRLWAPMEVTVVDKESGQFKTRDGLSTPVGMGYEYLAGREEDKIAGPTTLYKDSYDMAEDAVLAAEQAKVKLSAKSIDPGKYDLVLEPLHLRLTIHESVGHPLELDRVLGYEANYAGTSFATLDKWRSGKFQYGSDKVNIFADRTQPGSLGAVGYDDEGVKAKRWDLIKDGVLVNYQATRDQVHMIDQKESHGCSYADSWSSVQFQRMPNVSLAPGKDKYSVKDMIRDVEKGIYIVGRGSYSIDQQRYNFQFGGQLFYEIKNGEIVGQVEDVAYQSNTQEFWNSCSAICDSSDYRLGGTFFDGKGQPSQVSAVSHGCATSRFDDINVINTKRKIG